MLQPSIDSTENGKTSIILDVDSTHEEMRPPQLHQICVEEGDEPADLALYMVEHVERVSAEEDRSSIHSDSTTKTAIRWTSQIYGKLSSAVRRDRSATVIYHPPAILQQEIAERSTPDAVE